MTGRNVIVTGANSGIGRAAAKALAAKGARVVLAVRNTDKGRAAAAQMSGTTEVRELDLASLDSVRKFAAGWDGEIDLLINNAGIMIPPKSLTADGFELQFGTNHLGHFALTNLLLGHVTGRVVTVSSSAHRFGAIDFDDLQWERRPYKAWRAYGQSKLANLLFTAELQRKLIEVGSSVKATAAHPGYAATNLQFHSENRAMDVLNAVANRVLAQDEDGGALPTLYAAIADVPGNSFAGPAGFMEWRGGAKLVKRTAAGCGHGRRPPAVGCLRAAHRRPVPPGRGGIAGQREGCGRVWCCYRTLGVRSGASRSTRRTFEAIPMVLMNRPPGVTRISVCPEWRMILTWAPTMALEETRMSSGRSGRGLPSSGTRGIRIPGATS